MIAEKLPARAIAYEPRFDQRIDVKASYISRQLDTFLGERLNVLLSKNKYEIKNNLIYGEDMEDSFIEVMKRGIEYRERLDGENRVDRKREEAEVTGFLKTQEVMCNPQTSVGTMMLSISPQGGKDSLYQHNFYDIFTLRQAQGKRFIEARRYSSALSTDEYKDKLKPLYHMVNALDDAYFLSHPVKIDNSFFENADRLHSYLHRNHDFMKVEEFQKVLRVCERLKQEYVRRRDPRVLDAIMNKADIEAGLVEGRSSTTLTIDQEIGFLGRQPVRAVTTGCGSSGGLSGSSKPFSVAEFGSETDYDFDQPGPCKKCGAMDAKCGPCGICRLCDLSIRADQKFSLN